MSEVASKTLAFLYSLWYFFSIWYKVKIPIFFCWNAYIESGDSCGGGLEKMFFRGTLAL